MEEVTTEPAHSHPSEDTTSGRKWTRYLTLTTSNNTALCDSVCDNDVCLPNATSVFRLGGGERRGREIDSDSVG